MLGLPIPFMFFADCEDGKLEIIDGAQRVQTLVAFVTGKLVLSQLPKLSALHGFRFDDLSEAQKRRFWNRPLRIVVLEESTPKDVRQDIFNRINTSGIKAKESEIRRGSYPGRLTDYIDACSANERFVKLCPVTDAQEIRRERFELLLRFFAYSNCYLEFDHAVKDFFIHYKDARIPFVIQDYRMDAEAKASSIAEYIGLKPSRTRDYLNELIMEGIVVTEGSNRNRIYKLKS